MLAWCLAPETASVCLLCPLGSGPEVLEEMPSLSHISHQPVTGVSMWILPPLHRWDSWRHSLWPRSVWLPSFLLPCHMQPMRFTCPAHNLGHEVLVKLKNYFLKKKSTYAGYLSFFKKNIFYNMYYSLLQLSEFQEANINFMSLNTQFCFYPNLFILDLCFIWAKLYHWKLVTNQQYIKNKICRIYCEAWTVLANRNII